MWYYCVEPNQVCIKIKLLEGRNFTAVDDKKSFHLYCLFRMTDAFIKSVDSTGSVINPRILLTFPGYR